MTNRSEARFLQCSAGHLPVVDGQGFSVGSECGRVFQGRFAMEFCELPLAITDDYTFCQRENCHTPHRKPKKLATAELVVVVEPKGVADAGR